MRPKNARNTLPSRSEVRDLVARLRERAARGDAVAMGELIRLGIRKQAAQCDTSLRT